VIVLWPHQLSQRTHGPLFFLHEGPVRREEILDEIRRRLNP